MLLFLLVERLSVKNADKLGQFFGGLLFYLSIFRRNIVIENVSTMKKWAKKHGHYNNLLNKNSKIIAKKIFKSNAGNFFYSISLMNKSIDTVRKHIKICNSEILKKNEGGIILFSHSGPWELAAMLPKLLPSIFCNTNIAVMYRPLNNIYMNEWYLSKRERFGAKLYSREDGFLKIIRHIKNGSYMNIAFDIRMHQGKKIELFDKLASTSKIPYALHKATSAPVYTIYFSRADDLSWEIQFEEIVPRDNAICSETDLLRLANKHLEQKICENPHDYFFFQNRYK